MAKYSRKDTYNVTRRLYRLIRSHADRIYYKKLHHNVYGFYEAETEEITIDYRRDIISTLIHEALHHWNKDKSETWVLRHESLIMNALSQKQIKNILKIIGENVT